ncbi:MAG TPA: hypothetical protein VMS89_08545, partial [Methanoregulaceae archaeon]|nr:hypothetical protein [Methanoregulaceae archaeon]
QQVEDGASGVTLVSVTVTAKGAGTSNVRIQNLTMQDDHNGVFTPDLVTARLTTLAGNESGSTVTSVPSVTMQTGTDDQTVDQSVQTRITTQTPSVINRVTSPVTTFSTVETPGNQRPQEIAAPIPLYQRIPRLALYGFGLIAIIAAIALLYLGTTRKI